MTRNQNQHSRLLFLFSLTLLLINDLYLKQAYHNAITGKLSDFAGLFAFPYFLSLLFPKSIKVNYFFAGLFFIFWKSELIQPLFNTLKIFGFTFHRTVDYTDLIALIALPFSYYYWRHNCMEIFKIPAFKPFVISICCFAFIATSLPRKTKEINMECRIEVRIPKSLDTVKSRLEHTDEKIEETYNYVIDVSDRHLEINTQIHLKELPDGEISIRLDSIIDQEMKGELFFGFDEEDEAFADNLKCNDYQKLFLQSLQRIL